jgi:hypothetical protein
LWFVNLELDDEQAWRTVQAGIEDIYRAGIEGLESFVKAQ